MSIITEALKRAEQDRQQKAKQAVALQEMSSILTEEEETVETLIGKNRLPETDRKSIRQAPPVEGAGAIDFFKLLGFSLTRRNKKTLAAGTLVLAAIFLLVLLNWSGINKGLSPTGFFIKISKMFQFTSNGVTHDSQIPFKLTGISVVGEAYYAVINGLVVQKGDTVDGAFVKEIIGREVILETRTGEIKLKITP